MTLQKLVIFPPADPNEVLPDGWTGPDEYQPYYKHVSGALVRAPTNSYQGFRWWRADGSNVPSVRMFDLERAWLMDTRDEAMAAALSPTP